MKANITHLTHFEGVNLTFVGEYLVTFEVESCFFTNATAKKMLQVLIEDGAQVSFYTNMVSIRINRTPSTIIEII